MPCSGKLDVVKEDHAFLILALNGNKTPTHTLRSLYLLRKGSPTVLPLRIKVSHRIGLDTGEK